MGAKILCKQSLRALYGNEPRLQNVSLEARRSAEGGGQCSSLHVPYYRTTLMTLKSRANPSDFVIRRKRCPESLRANGDVGVPSSGVDGFTAQGRSRRRGFNVQICTEGD